MTFSSPIGKPLSVICLKQEWRWICGGWVPSKCSEGVQDNVSVVEARAVPAGPGKVGVWTVIRNWDDEAKTVPLALNAGGEIRQRQEVSFHALGSAQAQFVLKADDFSGASVELESNDSFSLDDKRALGFKSPPARRFGFWMPEAENAETQEERDFLKTAVASAETMVGIAGIGLRIRRMV